MKNTVFKTPAYTKPLSLLSDFVGNTPLMPLVFEKNKCVWGKSEFMNPSGSVKDRMAKHIIDNAESVGLIKPGDTLIEATSGNTGIAFSMLAAERGYKIKIVMPCNMSKERKQMMVLYGAELIEVDAGDFDGAIELRDELSEKKGWFNCNQFHNQLNIDVHYKTTGPEMQKQFLASNTDETPAVFVAGTGTGGTIMGAGRYLKECFPNIKIVAVEPAESPVMSGGEPGLHGIQGIGDGSKFLVDLGFVDEIVTISTAQATEYAKKIAKKRGVFVGISAAANVWVAKNWLEKNPQHNHALTILCDRGERYLSCL